MKCPYCKNGQTKVIDSRDKSDKVRRRRECKKCGKRFTTYETAKDLKITVVKKGGQNQRFDEEKIREGVEKAAKKTKLTPNEIDNIIENTVTQVREEQEKQEISSDKVGEIVKQELKKRDEVAYIRFASVYESFEDAEGFEEKIKSLKE